MPIPTRPPNRVACLCALIAFLSPSASIAAIFSIDGPLSINDAGSGVIGTLSPVPFLPSSPITTFGTFSGDILLFELSLDPSSAAVDQISVGGAGTSATGGIYYPGTGTQDPNQTGGAEMEFVASSLAFNFEHLATAPGNLDGGESTGVLGVVFNLGDLPPPGIGPGQILAGIASFAISSGANFSVNANVALIPEPGTTLLLGLGLAGLSSIRRPR